MKTLDLNLYGVTLDLNAQDLADVAGALRVASDQLGKREEEPKILRLDALANAFQSLAINALVYWCWPGRDHDEIDDAIECMGLLPERKPSAILAARRVADEHRRKLDGSGDAEGEASD